MSACEENARTNSAKCVQTIWKAIAVSISSDGALAALDLLCLVLDRARAPAYCLILMIGADVSPPRLHVAAPQRTGVPSTINEECWTFIGSSLSVALTSEGSALVVSSM
jgi:hypothetical protein